MIPVDHELADISSEHSSPQISCITVFYNRAALISTSIGSLLSQTSQDFEIIVVDDGSTDDTLSRLSLFDDARLHVTGQSNSGFTAAMNAAVRRSRGQYIAVHGAGDISLPERLEKQAAFLDANPEVGAVGCARLTDGMVIGPRAGVIERGPMLKTMLHRNPFSHGEVMFRRSLFDKVGGYRQEFRFAQDRDLWLRMGRYCDYAVLPDLLYERTSFHGGVTKTPRSLFLQTRLSQFAVQCAEDVDQDGRDLLDRIGPSAFFLTKPLVKQSKQYAARGLRGLRDGNMEAAEIFLTQAWNENHNLQSFAGILALWLSRYRQTNVIIRSMLRYRARLQTQRDD
jgi:glycosyltransferase involved in cell wall biosynthesis